MPMKTKSNVRNAKSVENIQSGKDISSCLDFVISQMTKTPNISLQNILDKEIEFNNISKFSDPIKALLFWGSQILVMPKEVMSKALFCYGLIEVNLTSLFVDFLFPGATVLDVGAHVGFFSTLAAELVEKTGKVFSFEPTPSTIEFLKKNCCHYEQINIIEKLAWSKKDNIKFHDFGYEFSAFNTAVSPRFCINQNIIIEDNPVYVETVTLDSFVIENNVKPDLIKIDVESAEMNVLHGMTEILNNMRPVVTIEVGDMQSAINDGVPLCRDILEFVMTYDYLPVESVGGKYRIHRLKTEKYSYDNIIMIPNERLPNRKPLGTIAIHQGTFY